MAIGKATVWKHGSNAAASTLVDYSANTDNVNPSFNTALQESTVFGKGSQLFESGLKNVKFSVEYIYTAAMQIIVHDIWFNGTAVNFEFAPNGTTTGNPKYTGSMRIESFSPPVQVGNLLKFTVSFQATDDVTCTAY